MMTGDGIGYVPQVRNTLDDQRAEHHVLPHSDLLLGGERPRLLQDAIGHADLAYVMQEAGGPQGALHPLREPAGSPKLHSEFGVLLRVLPGIAVLQVHRLHQRIRSRSGALLKRTTLLGPDWAVTEETSEDCFTS